MTIAASLRSEWLVAGAKPRADGLRAVPLTGTGLRVWAVVDESNRPGILLEAAPDQNISRAVATVSAESTALGAQIYPFVEDGRPVRALHLWSNRAELKEAFVGFCEALVLRCDRGEPIETAFRSCMEEFRDLVAGRDDAGPPAPFIGLLGELLILTELVAANPVASDYWSYPSLERHDFRNGHVALEVKTSLRSHQSKPIVLISALDQLEPPGGGFLFLHWIRLERNPAGSVGIEPLMDDIASRVSSQTAGQLWSRIRSAPGASRLAPTRYSIQERRAFRVEGTFPRLTSARLIARRVDPGIGKVMYELDLSSAAQFACDPGIANAALIGAGAS